MFNFSANHLLLLSRTECRSCVVFVMRADSTRRVYRRYDFTKFQTITPSQYCVSRKVNRTDTLYLVVDSVKPDNRHSPHSIAPVPADGAEGSTIGDRFAVGKNSDTDCLLLVQAVAALVCLDAIPPRLVRLSPPKLAPFYRAANTHLRFDGAHLSATS